MSPQVLAGHDSLTYIKRSESEAIHAKLATLHHLIKSKLVKLIRNVEAKG